MAKGDTRYSDEIAGDRGNYEWSARFSETDGYINITQRKDDGTLESILLSPDQVQALADFVRSRRRRVATTT